MKAIFSVESRVEEVQIWDARQPEFSYFQEISVSLTALDPESLQRVVSFRPFCLREGSHKFGELSAGTTLPTGRIQESEVLTKVSGQCRVSFHVSLSQIS